MDAAQRDNTRADTARKPLLIETFTIAPGELIKVRLGKFRNAQPRPEFRNSFDNPEMLESPSAISFNDIAIPSHGHVYTLIRTYQSFSQVTQQVSVLFRRQVDRDRLA